MSAESVPLIKRLPSNESSSGSSSENGVVEVQLIRQSNDHCLKSEDDAPLIGYSCSKNGCRRSDSPGSAEIVITEHSTVPATILMSQAPLPSSQGPHAFSELPDLVHKPLVLQQPGEGEESSMSWLYDFYPGIFSSPKEKLETFQDGPPLQSNPVEICTSHEHMIATSPIVTVAPTGPDIEHVHPIKSRVSGLPVHFEGESSATIFKSEEKYEVTLGAPTSIAQRTGEDTLTYLNKGQFYTLYFKGNANLQLPSKVKTVLALTFFEEHDKRVEFSRWQYWYNLQPNPNQKAFDIDRKSCKDIEIKPTNYHNAACFTWLPEVGAKIVVRVNCLSTEFSSQKGVKGYTLHFVSDTYEELDYESADPVHRAFCRVKIFRDKGAERKNKDETKNAERRLQKLAKQVKQQPGGVFLESELGASLFHAPSRETLFTSTSTLGHKPFLFVPQQDADSSSGMVRDHTAASDFLASIRDRESKRTFGNTLRQTKDEFGALEVDNDGDTECEGAPPKKAARIHSRKVITIYVKKQEDSVYKALLLDSPTVYDLKLEVGKKFDAPADMIKSVYKKTKKGLVVQFDDSMVEQFQNEDDFIIELVFDNQKGSFDLYLHY